MADAEEIDRIQEARQRARQDAETPPTRDFREQIIVDGEKPEKAGDLDDLKTQTEIMHPEPKEITLSYGETLKLYPLGARQTVKFHGYAMSAVAQAGGRPQGGNPQISLMQLNAVLTEDDVLAAKLLFYVAKAEKLPGKIDDKTAILRGAELLLKCQMSDYGRLYATLVSMTNFDKVLQEYVGKKPAAPAEEKQETK